VIKLLLLLTSIWCFCLLNGCGSGGASTTPPPPVATHFSVTSASSTPTAGTAFNITVTALDASNGEVSSYAGTVHFSSSDAQAVLPANTTLTNGTGSFTVTLKTAGSQTITATDTSTVTIKGTSNSINVFGPPATHFSVVAPANDTAGTFFTLTVNALDASNNVVTSYAGTVHFTSTDVQATLPANSTLTNGTETFSATMKTPGGQTISVTDTATASITGSSNSITVSGATASHFSVTVPATATAGTAFNFTVTALDSLGNTLAGYTGTVSFTSTDGQAALPANSTLTDGTGTFSGILKTDGNQTITATDIAAASITGTSRSIHVLTPASGFTPTGSMLNAREGHTATLLNDGRVLVVGGMHWAALRFCPLETICFRLNALASAEVFDPSTGEFTAAGGMSVARVFQTATLLGDGRVLVTGGDDRYGTTYGTAEIFDVSTGVFTPTGNMVYARSSHTATLLTNGKVLLAGGVGDNGTAPSAAELFDPTTGEFTAVGNITVSRFFHTATLLSDGKVLLAGGESSGATATAELYDPLTGTFTVTGNMTVARTSHRATLLKSGAVLITGGASSDGITATAELFDPATGTFAPTGSMGTARELHTATMLANGKVLVTGGIDELGTVAEIHYLSTAEMFDPTNGTFTPAGNMQIERSEHAAILLVNDTVLITGGINGDNAEYLNSLASAELFP
jgi:hypothetical protein